MDKNKNISKPSISVIGSGSWAIALTRVLSNNHCNPRWYIRNNDTIEYILKYHHHNSRLHSVHLNPEKIVMTNDINEAIKASDILVFAIPSAYFMSEMEKVNQSFKGKFIVSAIKGFVSDENLTIAEYFHQYHNIPFDKIAIISGPCHAEEVSMERLSYLTFSSKYEESARSISSYFANNYIKTVVGTDIYGVEYSAALKNIYAIATGMCHGVGYGDNFMAVLISNAFNELKQFLNASHPDNDRNSSLSAYLGDLLVTCYSQFSRNRTFGSMIGKGYTVSTATLEMNQIVEGYYAVKAIRKINTKYNVYMPIADAVYSILYENGIVTNILKELTTKLK